MRPFGQVLPPNLIHLQQALLYLDAEDLDPHATTSLQQDRSHLVRAYQGRNK